MRINPYAEALKKKGKALFLPFVVLGDPDKKRSIEIIRKLVDSGADALELGLPFSDPPADGPIIQEADNRALRAGIRIDDCFEILKEVRACTDIPIGLLVYYNLILQRGISKFFNDCVDCGITSVLVADLPLEHMDEILATAKGAGIQPVMLISEITTDKRMAAVASVAEGYLYVVSYLGVTGVESSVLEEKIRVTLERARRHCDLPLFVGFGINTVEQAGAALKAGADGYIVGSRIVREIPDTKKIMDVCREMKAFSLTANRS